MAIPQTSPEFRAGSSLSTGLQCDDVKILLVEDEKEIAEFVKNGLSEKGYQVTVCDNGNDGLEAALSGEWDAILLDIMLPGRDGLSILKLLRQRKHTVPVVVSECARRSRGARGRACNWARTIIYRSRFYMAELLARLESVVRRSGGQGLSRLKQADLDVDLIEHRVWRNGERRGVCVTA